MNPTIKITLLRHAIARDRKAGESDFLRVLPPDGRKACLKHLEKQSEHLHDIDLILCSPSMRTRQTYSLLSSLIDKKSQEIIYDEAIYTFEDNYEKLLEIIKNNIQHRQHICLIGHNNSISALATYLTKQAVHMKKGKVVITELNK